jgi:hypothetical protein
MPQKDFFMSLPAESSRNGAVLSGGSRIRSRTF